MADARIVYCSHQHTPLLTCITEITLQITRDRFYVLSKNCEKLLLASPCMSVCPSSWNNSTSTGRIFMKVDIWVFLKKSVWEIQVSLKSDKNNRYFTWRSIHIFDKVKQEICTENQNTHFTFHNYFPENRAVNEKIWKNTVQPDRPQMTIRRMRIACWIPEAKSTRSECVILVVFPLQQWLHHSASKLRYTSCIVLKSLFSGM